MEEQNSRRTRTEGWYYNSGWAKINKWIAECSAKGLTQIYIENFEIFDSNLDKTTLIRLFDRDTTKWSMKLEDDGVLVVEKKSNANSTRKR